MQQRGTRVEVARVALIGAMSLVVGYLAVLAVFPDLAWLGWFGRAGSAHSVWTILIAVALITAVCVLSYHRQLAERPGAIPVVTIALLAAISAILAFSSYLRCGDTAEGHPPVLSALLWTAGAVRGNVIQPLIDGKPCPAQPPVALQIAGMAGQAAVYVSVISVAIALLTTQLDRARIRFARSVTVIVDVDEDSRAMVGAVARSLNRGSRLALIVPAGTVRADPELRDQGARIIGIDLTRTDVLESLPIWKKLDRLYLLSASSAANLQRLAAINRRLVRSTQRYLPLVVRIDDPWQAESWRAKQLGGSDDRWTADTAGIYEATATRLLHQIMNTGKITTVIVCGTSPLTLALCADLVRQRLDRTYYCPPDSPAPPALTIVAGNAEEYRLDHEFRQQQLGLPPTAAWIDAVGTEPSTPALTPLITASADGETCLTAVIIVADHELPTSDATLGTRLAARFPSLPIYVWDPKVPENSDVDAPPVVGALRTFRLAMDTTVDRPLDAFERAARLIHERYAAQNRAHGRNDDATKGWDELNDFYRQQNRRQVRNAFKIAEDKGGHSWDTFNALPDPPVAAENTDDDAVECALQRLRAIGFDRDAALAMARAEHNDWLSYLHDEGWRRSERGTERDEARRRRPDLVGWSEVENDPEKLANALTSLAETLYTLRQLGYRSRPAWQHFRRIGEVNAIPRNRPWTWTTESGDTMHAAAGDWEASEGDLPSWSVRDEIFRSTYEHIDGNRWRQTGFVRARRARDGETIHTLEGRTVAPLHGWVVKGRHGEEWVVPADVFDRHYAPVDASSVGTV